MAMNHEQQQQLKRRAIRLDEMPDAEIEEMARADIPRADRYGLLEIPGSSSQTARRERVLRWPRRSR
ncbi:MAG TPA: hypothetical protein VGR91_04170 [Stellaceae bacterium]|nr:hypothetical protein [Stellaceae bacterium]